ncbi:MAG: threonine/serine exporter family protein [Clostridia bacterium]|nr:threonine/serine exporter family protein [Clostridia bacterium]
MEYLITGFFSTVSTVLFALSARSPLKPAIISGCLGGLGFVLYLLFGNWLSEAGAVFYATLAACIGAEIIARLIKTPTTVLSIPAIIPLVPGIMLYQAMLYFGEGDNSGGVNKAVDTLLVAGALALAVTISTLVGRLIFGPRNTKKKEE